MLHVKRRPGLGGGRVALLAEGEACEQVEAASLEGGPAPDVIACWLSHGPLPAAPPAICRSVGPAVGSPVGLSGV